MLASCHTCGYMTSSHILMIHRCSLLDKLAPPYFHTSAGIPSPPGAFPSFSLLIALTISSIVGYSARAVLTLRFYMFSHLAITLLILDVHIVSSVDSTLPLIHCKNPSCRSCQRVFVAPQPSFPTIQTFELVYISVVFCRHLCKLRQRISFFKSVTVFGGLGPFWPLNPVESGHLGRTSLDVSSHVCREMF